MARGEIRWDGHGSAYGSEGWGFESLEAHLEVFTFDLRISSRLGVMLDRGTAPTGVCMIASGQPGAPRRR